MKTKVLMKTFFVMLCMMPALTIAQVQFFIKQGMVISTLSDFGNLGDNNHSQFSFTVGGIAKVPLNESFSVQPEVNYIRKGRFEKNEIAGISVKNSLTADYLQIPVLLRITPKDLLGDVKTKFFFTTGIYESILVGSTQILEENNRISGSKTSKNLNNTDFGFILGGGIQFPFRQKNLQMEVRYDMGLTKISEQLNDYHTKAFSITLGMVL